ncbi:hypothetical protein [Ureibacillus acetophenoni]
MSFKRKPTVIKFDKDYDNQKFINWALNKSEPNKGINKAKNAMRLAQHSIELDKITNQPKKIVIQHVDSTTPSKVLPSRVRIKKRIRDGENEVNTNNRHG